MFRTLVVLMAGVFSAPAHDVITTKLTWSAEISRIIQRRCLSCHGAGSAAIPLTNFEEARPWAKAIRDEVLQRRMPPWGAIKGYGELRNDPSLTQDEIMRIAEWVEGGAPEGDPKYLPAAMKRSEPPVKMHAGLRVRSSVPGHPAVLLGIRPLTTVADAKITARKPDGSVEPLLWLHGYQASWKRTFILATPVFLPAGTAILSEPKTPLELLLKSPQQVR